MHAVDEPGRVASGILALLVHLLFFGMLVIGISWQKKIVEPVMVDLWESLPEPVRKPSPPPPKIVETPPKPAPEVRKEAPPPPPPKVEAPPKPSPAEIELREKLRKQKEEEEAKRLEEKNASEAEKRRLEEEHRTEEEAKRLEEKKALEAEKRRLEEERRAEEEVKRLDQENLKREEEARRQEEQKQLEEQRRERAAAVERERQQQEVQRKQREAEEGKRRADAAVREKQQLLINDFRARIQAKVIPRIVMPQDLKGRPEGVYEVTLLPGGDILDVQLKRSSGVPAYDAAVERAINLSSPLPVPDDSDLFQQYFRKFSFTFKPPS